MVTSGNDALLGMSALSIKDEPKAYGWHWRRGDRIRFSGPLYPLTGQSHLDREDLAWLVTKFEERARC
jgi:hypothetical protein